MRFTKEQKEMVASLISAGIREFSTMDFTTPGMQDEDLQEYTEEAIRQGHRYLKHLGYRMN